jgi:hypothetical protein
MNTAYRTEILAAVSLALALTGCTASSPRATGMAERSVITTLDPTVTIVLVRDPRGSYHEIEADRSQVWAAVQRAYEDLDLPIGTRDLPGGVVGNQQISLTQRLDGERLSRFVSCGVDVNGVPTADSSTIRLSLLSYVRAATAATTEVETRVNAIAVPRGTGGNVQCTTTGRLEQRLIEQIATYLGS